MEELRQLEVDWESSWGFEVGVLVGSVIFGEMYYDEKGRREVGRVEGKLQTGMMKALKVESRAEIEGIVGTHSCNVGTCA